MGFSATKPLGVAVVGTGFGQKVHIPGFKEHPKTQVVAVYHRELAKAQAIANDQAIPHACCRLADLLALPEVAAVSLATPPFLHYPMAQDVLKAGKHLLLEKPTALNAAEAQSLVELAAQRGLVTALDFEYRFVPAWQHLHELLVKGYVGKPYLIKIDWLMESRADKNRPWNWYAQKSQGGGALGALGSHSFDYINWLFGPVKRLSASLSTSILERMDPLTGQLRPVDADDTCLINLELANGTPVQVALSSVSRSGRGHWLEVYGDRGTLVLGSGNQKDYVHGFQLRGSLGGAPLAAMPIPKHLEFERSYMDGRLAPFLRLVDNWVTGIELGRSLSPSLAEGLVSQRLMDLTHQSHDSGQWIDL
ncbi:MAG: Gfo/Idh/MocA family oxidoreductase [Synechococcales cyanobacterium RM1_1_8]|nr:Gfo/Idh/MocA family oxidoreductase [Synechococcales cyanobacterium RM1_1_8]